MIKIGITGAIASGKTTASKILSSKKGPLFSADKVVKELYKNSNFKKLIIKKFKIKKNFNSIKLLKREVLKNNENIKKLEKIIHPIVRIKMKKFATLHKKRKRVFFEIPLLVESNLMKYFDIIVLIRANKKLRLKRFKAKGGNKKLFDILNNKQLSDIKKIKFSKHIIVNEKNLLILKKKLLSII